MNNMTFFCGLGEQISLLGEKNNNHNLRSNTHNLGSYIYIWPVDDLDRMLLYRSRSHLLLFCPPSLSSTDVVAVVVRTEGELWRMCKYVYFPA
jgi:hypothetical protein